MEHLVDFARNTAVAGVPNRSARPPNANDSVRTTRHPAIATAQPGHRPGGSIRQVGRSAELLRLDRQHHRHRSPLFRPGGSPSGHYDGTTGPLAGGSIRQVARSAELLRLDRQHHRHRSPLFRAGQVARHASRRHIRPTGQRQHMARAGGVPKRTLFGSARKKCWLRVFRGDETLDKPHEVSLAFRERFIEVGYQILGEPMPKAETADHFMLRSIQFSQ